MDPITTGVGAALIAKALPEQQRGPIGVWVMTGAAVFPDLDILSPALTGDPMANLTIHRGFTHSFFGVVTLAPLLALLARACGKDKSYRRLLGLCGLALLWHIFTDLPTSWGTIVFWPFSWQRVAWDWIFIIDLIYTGALLLPQLVAWIYRRRGGAVARGVATWAGLSLATGLLLAGVAPAVNSAVNWPLFAALCVALAAVIAGPALRGWGFDQRRELFCRVGLAGFAGYVALTAVSHTLAMERVEQLAAKAGLKSERLAALPQPLSPFRWAGMALTAEGVYRTGFHLLDNPDPAWSFVPSASNSYVTLARALPDVRTYLWFARFPVARYRNSGENHIVEFAELRFSLAGPADEETEVRFGYRVVFNRDGEVVESGFPRRR